VKSAKTVPGGAARYRTDAELGVRRVGDWACREGSGEYHQTWEGGRGHTIWIMPNNKNLKVTKTKAGRGKRNKEQAGADRNVVIKKTSRRKKKGGDRKGLIKRDSKIGTRRGRGANAK